MSSHKGDWNRVKDRKAWDECPLWDKDKKDQEIYKDSDENNSDSNKTKERRKLIAKCRQLYDDLQKISKHNRSKP